MSTYLLASSAKEVGVEICIMVIGEVKKKVTDWNVLFSEYGILRSAAVILIFRSLACSLLNLHNSLDIS